MGHHHRVAAEPGGHPQAHRVDPDRHRAPAGAHPDRPRPHRQRTHPHIPRTHRHAAARCPQLQAASHPVTVGVDPQQGALVQQHPDGALTDRHGRRRAGQRHPPGHRQPVGDRRVVRSHGGAGRPGHSDVASREVAALQAADHDQGQQHHHHASNKPPAAPGCIHADSRLCVRSLC
jgi:hypothetical protein